LGDYKFFFILDVVTDDEIMLSSLILGVNIELSVVNNAESSGISREVYVGRDSVLFF